MDWKQMLLIWVGGTLITTGVFIALTTLVYVVLVR